MIIDKRNALLLNSVHMHSFQVRLSLGSLFETTRDEMRLRQIRDLKAENQKLRVYNYDLKTILNYER